MKIPAMLAVGAFSAIWGAAALAAVTAEEARQLGGELTPFGAIKAGNADNSIPAYSGGLSTPPADFDPKSGRWSDPYASDKPVVRITAANMEQYSAKLSEGVKYLLKTNSDYYLDIYPTHRSMAYPQAVLDASVRNATTCKTTDEQLGVAQDCRGGVPFPIPKSGYEVMWNKTLAFWGTGGFEGSGVRSWMISSSGTPVMTSEIRSYSEKPFWQVDRTDRNTNMATRIYSKTDAPSRKAGEATGYADFLDPSSSPRKAWSYAPGQRRIKMAPEFSYDTPVSTTGGVMLYDEIFLFSGLMDRFDFKLVGKKEMYIPYNNYKLAECKVAQWSKPKTINPECERWELHRVWVVESTLKPGMRHVYSKRTYYLDEDNYTSGLMDGWDQAGKLYRTAVQYSIQAYNVPSVYAPSFVIYDFNKGMYSRQSDYSDGKIFYVPAKSDRELSPESIAGSGIR